MLQAGDMAPDFEIPVLIGGVKKAFRLSEHRGKQNLVLAFYPVNWEPVSTQQMVGYQVEREKFQVAPGGSGRHQRGSHHEYDVLGARNRSFRFSDGK